MWAGNCKVFELVEIVRERSFRGGGRGRRSDPGSSRAVEHDEREDTLSARQERSEPGARGRSTDIGSKRVDRVFPRFLVRGTSFPDLFLSS